MGDAGWGGYLHIFNFLYAQIDTPWVSLAEVGKRASIELANAKRLTVSTGPCRLFTEHWQVPKLFGALRLQAELQYINPLKLRIETLETRLDELEDDLNGALSDILDAVGPGGAIQKNLRTAQGAIDDSRDDIGRVRTEVGSHSRQIDALQDTTKEIRDAIRRL